MRKIILIICGIACYINGNTCYNERHYDKDGIETIYHSFNLYFPSFPDTAYANHQLKKYPLSNIDSYKWDIQSNLAIYLAYLGRTEESLQILRRLQQSIPNEYSIAANLGTTYELLGQNDSALYYIKKSMRLNPDSHEGTEWVHVKILEAKLAIAKNPDWLTTHHVIGTGASFNSLRSKVLNRKTGDIQYQLRERIKFTPMPDKLMENILNELGDLYATQYSVEFAHIAYRHSLMYDPVDSYDIKTKMQEIEKVLKAKKIAIPDMEQHYGNRDNMVIVEEVMDTVKQFETAAPIIIKPATQKKENNNSLIYVLAGVCVLLVGYLGVYLYRQKLRNR